MGAREFFRRHLRWDIGGDRGSDGPPQGSQGNPDEPPLSGDTSWAPGDLAECIVSGQWWQVVGPGVLIPAHGPEMSDVNKVISVEPGVDVRTGEHVLFLKFSAWPRPYVATAFRKVVPVADKAERADPAFVDDLRRIAPQAAPVACTGGHLIEEMPA